MPVAKYQKSIVKGNATISKEAVNTWPWRKQDGLLTTDEFGEVEKKKQIADNAADQRSGI